ncbi:MAG: hypothetical protein IPH80_02710 [Myxococcales bacterium]|jgi:hypothetical protein|nr:hypothetical protein [Myxococcales bacterium]
MTGIDARTRNACAVAMCCCAFATAGRAQPSPPSRVETLTRTARSVARHGQCAALPALAAAVRDLDPAYYATTFAVDPIINGCQQGVDTTPPPPSPPVAMPQGAQLAADATEEPPPPQTPVRRCRLLKGYFEPSVWTGQAETFMVRHAVGAGLALTCDGAQRRLVFKLGAHGDLGTGGAFAGLSADFELPVSTALTVGVGATRGWGTNPRSGLGLRLHTRHVWLGVDWYFPDAATDRDGPMVGIGLGGAAATQFALVETYGLRALYYFFALLSLGRAS